MWKLIMQLSNTFKVIQQTNVKYGPQVGPSTPTILLDIRFHT